MADRLMLLDTASLYFRAFYGVPDKITREDGTPVNAVRGLLDMIARLTTEFEATRLIACWDDNWRPTWRVDLLPSYKAQRLAQPGDDGADIDPAHARSRRNRHSGCRRPRGRRRDRHLREQGRFTRRCGDG
jgi:5'-3' exonuclease